MKRQRIRRSFESDLWKSCQMKIKMFFRLKNREPLIILNFNMVHVSQKTRFSIVLLFSKSKIIYKKTSVAVTPVPNHGAPSWVDFSNTVRNAQTFICSLSILFFEMILSSNNESPLRSAHSLNFQLYKKKTKFIGPFFENCKKDLTLARRPL